MIGNNFIKAILNVAKTQPTLRVINDQYVTQTCESGDWQTLGTNTWWESCSNPEYWGNQYVAQTCESGDWQNQGTNTVLTDCSYPSDGQYVSQQCNLGEYNWPGNDTQLTDCTYPTPDDGYFVTCFHSNV